MKLYCAKTFRTVAKYARVTHYNMELRVLSRVCVYICPDLFRHRIVLVTQNKEREYERRLLCRTINRSTCARKCLKSILYTPAELDNRFRMNSLS